MDYKKLLKRISENGLPLVLSHDQIIELWFSGEGTLEQKHDLEEAIEHSVITGALKVIAVWYFDPNVAGGRTDLGIDRWKHVDRGKYRKIYPVFYEIHRDDFADWLQTNEKVSLPEGSMLSSWWGDIPLGVLFGDAPNYEEWDRATRYLLLRDAICFAIGVSPNEAYKWKWSSANAQTYNTLEKRAENDIDSDLLDGREAKGVYKVDKTAFYKWVVAQGMLLTEEFKRRKPIIPTRQDAPSVVPGSYRPEDLKLIVDDVNQAISLVSNSGEKTKYARADLLGRGTVTWELLVWFARCGGSLEENNAGDVKRLNTSVNRKNLGEKLQAAFGLAKPPIIPLRKGVMCFGSIQLKGGASSTDALDRIRSTRDDQATEFLANHGDDMPLLD